MGRRLRKTLKIAGWSFGGLFALVVMFVGLLAFPGFMFAHQLEYRNLTVYSDEDLRAGIEPVLARVDAQIAASELNDTALGHDIYFGHANRPFRALQRAHLELVHQLTGIDRRSAINYNASWPPHVSHVVILDVPDAIHDAVLRDAWPGRINMTHVLTHEVGHTLVFNKVGLGGMATLPFWKAEGYPEYIASHTLRTVPGYSLRSSVTRVLTADLAWLRDEHGNLKSPRYNHNGGSYLKDENGDFWHTSYYLARVLVEYSLDVKEMSFEQLADPGVRDTEVMRELLADYAAGRL